MPEDAFHKLANHLDKNGKRYEIMPASLQCYFCTIHFVSKTQKHGNTINSIGSITCVGNFFNLSIADIVNLLRLKSKGENSTDSLSFLSMPIKHGHIKGRSFSSVHGQIGIPMCFVRDGEGQQDNTAQERDTEDLRYSWIETQFRRQRHRIVLDPVIVKTKHYRIRFRF